MSVTLVYLRKESLPPDIFFKQLTEVLNDLLVESSLGEGELNLIITGDDELERLNRQYRGKEGTTDVLSFPYLEPGMEEIQQGEEFAVGDIYISLDRALNQAEEAGTKVEMEIALLAIHGLLHLAGYEHDSESGAELMHQKEQETLTSLKNRIKGEQ